MDDKAENLEAPPSPERPQTPCDGISRALDVLARPMPSKYVVADEWRSVERHLKRWRMWITTTVRLNSDGRVQSVHELRHRETLRLVQVHLTHSLQDDAAHAPQALDTICKHAALHLLWPSTVGLCPTWWTPCKTCDGRGVTREDEAHVVCVACCGIGAQPPPLVVPEAA